MFCPSHRKLLIWLYLLLGSAILAACAADKPAYVERPVEEIYNEAMNQLGQRNYVAAAKSFDEVERRWVMR